MVAKFFAAIAIALASIQTAKGSKGFRRVYSPTSNNNSKAKDEVDEGDVEYDEWPILHPLSETKPKLAPYELVFKDRNFKDKNFVRDNKARFRGFKYGNPRWGLVVSANNFTKISECQKMSDVEVVQLSHYEFEIIADAKTLQSLFEDENEFPLRRSIDSETDLLAYNDTTLDLIDVKFEPTEEPKKKCTKMSLKNREMIGVTLHLCFGVFVLVIVFVVLMLTLKPQHLFNYH